MGKTTFGVFEEEVDAADWVGVQDKYMIAL